MYTLNQQTFIELLVCTKHRGKHTEILDWMAAHTELLDAHRKEVVDREIPINHRPSPFCGLRKWKGPERDILDDIQDLDLHVPCIEDTCVELTEL